MLAIQLKKKKHVIRPTLSRENGSLMPKKESQTARRRKREKTRMARSTWDKKKAKSQIKGRLLFPTSLSQVKKIRSRRIASSIKSTKHWDLESWAPAKRQFSSTNKKQNVETDHFVPDTFTCMLCVIRRSQLAEAKSSMNVCIHHLHQNLQLGEGKSRRKEVKENQQRPYQATALNTAML